MPTTLLLALALSLAPNGDPTEGEAPAPPQDRVEGWRSDLAFLVAEARRVNPNPARPAFSAEFEEQAEQIRAAIPDLTDDQVLTQVSRLVAILGDGHSGLYGPDKSSTLEFERRVLPLKFYQFPDGLYVVGGVGEGADLAGSRVESFGSVPAEEVLQRMSACRGVDNRMTWTWMGPQFYLGRLAMLEGVGVDTGGGEVRLELVTLAGEERTVTIPGGDHELPRKLRPFPGGLDGTPLYLSQVDTNYWLKPLDRDALYVQFNQVRDAPKEPLGAFAERLRTTLLDEESTTLIVDVRHNNGGNNNLLRPLVRAMIEFEMRSPDHRIFVLMGRNTFSAAQNFLNRVERWTDATFVGEPSSSSPNFVGEENEILLPYSRVRGSLSNRYWQDSDPWDQREWIEPDLPLRLTAEAYFEGVDPVLEHVLDQL